MSESAINLYCKVEALITESDVRSENCLGHGLSRYIAVIAIFQTDTTAIQIGNIIGVAAVSVGNESIGL